MDIMFEDIPQEPIGMKTILFRRRIKIKEMKEGHSVLVEGCLAYIVLGELVADLFVGDVGLAVDGGGELG